MKKTNEQIIAQLIDIKKSIIAGADDVLWMHNRVNESVCEHIDSMVMELSETDNIEQLRDELESHYSPPPLRMAHPLVVPMRPTTAHATRRAFMRELCDQFAAHVMDSFDEMHTEFNDAGEYMTAALEVFVNMKNHEHAVDNGDAEQFEDVGRNGWKIDGRGDE